MEIHSPFANDTAKILKNALIISAVFSCENPTSVAINLVSWVFVNDICCTLNNYSNSFML
jgi:hypothetical protein